MDVDTLAALRLIPLELASLLKEGRNSRFWPDCFLENFGIIHARGSTTFAVADPGKYTKSINAVWGFLEGQLQGRPLTWSDEGATSKGPLNELMVNARSWALSALGPLPRELAM